MFRAIIKQKIVAISLTLQKEKSMYPHLPTLKEVCLHGTKSFPCAIYQTRSIGKGTLVKHHWHDEVEILYFFGGEFRLEINMEQFFVRSEALYFINPGELHSIYTEKAGSPVEDAVVFSLDILSFDTYDAAQMQLIQPIQNGKMLFPRCLLPNHPGFLPVRDAFLDTMHSFGHTLNEAAPLEKGAVTDDMTNQLFIKSSLLRILAVLSSHRLFTPTEKNLDKRVEGIKAVLTFIRENYKEKIYIQDLASQVHMNEQYFCRFFKKHMGLTFLEYQNEVRLSHIYHDLITTKDTLQQILERHGFTNYKLFRRMFQEHFHGTPSQIRNC